MTESILATDSKSRRGRRGGVARAARLCCLLALPALGGCQWAKHDLALKKAQAAAASAQQNSAQRTAAVAASRTAARLPSREAGAPPPEAMVATMSSAPRTAAPAPAPPPRFNTESYDRVQETRFHDVMQQPLSTFSIDVDTASYANVRRFLNAGELPPPDAVRIEELVNYFPYDYPAPRGDAAFAVDSALSKAPWQPGHQLLRIGLQGKRIPLAGLPPANLVFLIDVSGSMSDDNKLPLLVRSLKLLVHELRPEDRVAIVVYAGEAGVVLPPTSGANKQAIDAALDSLHAGGSTAGGEGLKLAYTVAKKDFRPGANNRIILATDGDFNVGPSSTGELVRLIEQKRKEGVYLSVLGLGMGNYKDATMEQLADRGNGNYAYLDSLLEARKVLVSQLAGTLCTIAKDVKLQVEFNPARVKSYRLIGYEDRRLEREDFTDDKKDAGELGAGHSVTALYEIVPNDASAPAADQLVYQSTSVKQEALASAELATVRLRYQEPATGAAREFSSTVSATQVKELKDAPENLRFAAAVAEWGLLLAGSQLQGEADFGQVLDLARGAKGEDDQGLRAEFIRLVEASRSLAKTQARGERN